METKRFIGSDMPRIYARVKREFGSDAVIVRTRSLYREGADPLIEVIAAPPVAPDGLPLDLQQVLISGALDHAASSHGLTVGDLEDLVARDSEHEGRRVEQLDRFVHEQVASEPPAWLEGYVADAPQPPFGEPDVQELPAFVAEPAPHAPVHFPLPEMESAPSGEWAGRPRPAIVTRPRRTVAADEPELPVVPLSRWPAEDAAPVTARPPGAPAPTPDAGASSPGLFDRIVAAGLSREAAHLVSRVARHGDTPALALAACLEARDVCYPDEHHTALISIQGPVASGRTTALMRMALDCSDSGRPTLLVAADGVHVAAREQVRAYGEAIGLDAISTFEPHEVIRAATRASVGTCLFIDTPAGPWQAPPVAGIPHFAYLALPAHWSRAALDHYLQGVRLSDFAGAILTFSDVATDLSPVLSLIVESALGVAFLSSSRDVSTGIEVADPLMLASGIFTTPTRESTNGRLSATA